MKIIKVSICGMCPWIARNVLIKGIKDPVTICGAIAKYRIVELNKIPEWCPLENLPKVQEKNEKSST